MAYAGADTRHLVAGDRGPYAGAAEHDAPLARPRQHRAAYFARNIREVYRLRIVASEVCDLMSLLF